MIAQLLRDAALPEAFAKAKADVKADPSSAKPRLLYFQLCAVMGKWDEAAQQLDLLADLDPGTLLLKQIFLDTLAAEKKRREVFAASAHPKFPDNAPQWLETLFQATIALSEGRTTEAESLRSQAFDAAPQVPGKINDSPFQWLADADTRFGPVVEYFCRDEYCWAPWSHFSAIHCEPPHDLRDLVWFPAQFVTADGGMFSGFLPSRYPGISESSNNTTLLARSSTWQTIEGETTIGEGQRILATDSTEFSLLEVRTISFEPDDNNSTLLQKA